MGRLKHDLTKAIAFTEDVIDDRDLIIKMLKYEDSIILSYDYTESHPPELAGTAASFEVIYSIHRKVLSHFGFDTSDQSVENYRKIFSHYYQSATNYDAEVLNSVAYMRENRCVYYTKPILNVGDTIPDCDLYDLDGLSKTTIKNTLQNGTFDYAFVAGYSSS